MAGEKSKKKKERSKFREFSSRAELGSAAVYTTDRPGPVIFMYVCVGTVYRALEPTDPLVVAHAMVRARKI